MAAVMNRTGNMPTAQKNAGIVSLDASQW